MFRVCLFAGFAALAAGCGKSAPTYDDKTLGAADQIRKVAVAYNQAYSATRKPPTAEDLKSYLKKHGDPNTLLTSPLDGKPLVIVPGLSPDATPGAGEQPIVAYEQNGLNGRRLTVDIRGTVVFYSDEEFAQLKFVGGHQPAR